jgi:RNA polymerase sigma factor (sigma-70 family)
MAPAGLGKITRRFVPLDRDAVQQTLWQADLSVDQEGDVMSRIVGAVVIADVVGKPSTAAAPVSQLRLLPSIEPSSIDITSLTHADDEPDLLEAVRGGSSEAFAELYRRHRPAIFRYARRLVRRQEDAHDIAAETFAKALAALRRGKGPTVLLRPYLLRIARNVAIDRMRADNKIELRDDLTDEAGTEAFDDRIMDQVDRDLISRAFATLPPRWQQVLTLTEFEELSPAEAAERLGISPNSLTSLAYRAREGLRQAYVIASVSTPGGGQCELFQTQIAQISRQSNPVIKPKLAQHLKSCTWCATKLQQTKEVNSTLRPVVKVCGPRHTSETS